MRHQPVSFRLGPRERGVLEDLAERLGRPKVDVVRLAIRTLDEIVAEEAGGARRVREAVATRS